MSTVEDVQDIKSIKKVLNQCVDLIKGNFILADFKITSILQAISQSEDVYNLIAVFMKDFNFDREFHKSQVRKGANNNELIVPTEEEKLLPYVFCVLVNIKNRNLDFDIFLKDYFSDNTNDFDLAYKNFAKKIIYPFRNMLAKHFNIDVTEISFEDNDFLNEEKNEENLLLSNDSELGENEMNYEYENNDEDFESDLDNDNIEDYSEDYDDEQPELADDETEFSRESIEEFLIEIKGICKDIKSALHYDPKTKQEQKDDLEYILDVIIDDCDSGDVKNVSALVTAFDSLTYKMKKIKEYSKELRRRLIDFFD